MVLYVCEHHSCWIPEGFKNVPNFKTGRMVLDLKVGEKKLKPFGWQKMSLPVQLGVLRGVL